MTNNNQCDGCLRGLPINEYGNHIEGLPGGIFGCTKNRYENKVNNKGRKYKIVEMYFEENNDRKNDPYFTGLSFLIEDGRTVKQYSTDMIKPYDFKLF